MASSALDPFFSPDGQWLGYFVSSSLMKVPVKGGTPTCLRPFPGARSAGAGERTGEAVTAGDVEEPVSRQRGRRFLGVRHGDARLPAADREPASQCVAVEDRLGRAEPLAVEAASYGYVAVSPDGRRVAFDQNRSGNRDVWVLDLARLSLTQLTKAPTEDILPRWSTDGSRVFFGSNRSGTFDVYSQRADGADEPRVEFAGPGEQIPQIPLPDGSGILVYEDFSHVALLTFSTPQALQPLLQSSADERLPQVSPDGQWMVYESDESGNRVEVFLRPFPAVAGRREKISVEGGRYPLWAPKGNEIYYVTPDGDMMAVPITTTPSLTIGTPTRLFSIAKPPVTRGGRPFDVSPTDGRFLVVTRRGASEALPMASIVLNWLRAPD